MFGTMAITMFVFLGAVCGFVFGLRMRISHAAEKVIRAEVARLQSYNIKLVAGWERDIEAIQQIRGVLHELGRYTQQTPGA